VQLPLAHGSYHAAQRPKLTFFDTVFHAVCYLLALMIVAQGIDVPRSYIASAHLAPRPSPTQRYHFIYTLHNARSQYLSVKFASFFIVHHRKSSKFIAVSPVVTHALLALLSALRIASDVDGAMTGHSLRCTRDRGGREVHSLF
jgi:hypothetical protein